MEGLQTSVDPRCRSPTVLPSAYSFADKAPLHNDKTEMQQLEMDEAALKQQSKTQGYTMRND